MSLESRQKLLVVAKAILEGKEDFLEGVRKINSLRHEVDDPENEVFLIFQGIDSETDHIPDKSRSTLFHKDYLQKIDIEVQEVFLECKNEINKACEKILEIYK